MIPSSVPGRRRAAGRVRATIAFGRRSAQRLALSRNVHRAYVRTAAGNFSPEGLRGFDLKGKTLGVIGAGSIGLHVVRMARGFDMDVAVSDIRQTRLLSEVLGFRTSRSTATRPSAASSTPRSRTSRASCAAERRTSSLHSLWWSRPPIEPGHLASTWRPVRRAEPGAPPSHPRTLAPC